MNWLFIANLTARRGADQAYTIRDFHGPRK